MSIRIISKSNQAYGAFNGGQIVENKPIGFPQDGGFVRPYSNLFYWARARAVIDSTIGLHPHQGFEIMSFVLKGNIRHFDTKMDAWKELEAGSAQIIRAGNGIQHAEHMYKDAVMFQIWMDPNLSKTLQIEASYDDYATDELHKEEKSYGQIIHYAGGKGPMHLDSDGVSIQQWAINSPMELNLNENQILSAYVIEGNGVINGESVEGDDYIIAEDIRKMDVRPDQHGLTLFAITTPAQLTYKTYVEQMQERAQM
jgi:redox-sensitive bicupin YhaK (pirin superfamily)